MIAYRLFMHKTNRPEIIATAHTINDEYVFVKSTYGGATHRQFPVTVGDDGRWTVSSSRNAIPGRTKEVFWTFATKDEAVGFAMTRAREF